MSQTTVLQEVPSLCRATEGQKHDRVPGRPVRPFALWEHRVNPLPVSLLGSSFFFFHKSFCQSLEAAMWCSGNKTRTRVRKSVPPLISYARLAEQFKSLSQFCHQKCRTNNICPIALKIFCEDHIKIGVRGLGGAWMRAILFYKP